MKSKNKKVIKQGRIHDCPCRGRLGRGSNELGRGRNDLGRGINNHRILIPGLFYLQTAQKRQKSKRDGPTDRRTDRPIDGLTDRRTDGPTDTVTYRSRCPRQKRSGGIVLKRWWCFCDEKFWELPTFIPSEKTSIEVWPLFLLCLT